MEQGIAATYLALIEADELDQEPIWLESPEFLASPVVSALMPRVRALATGIVLPWLNQEGWLQVCGTGGKRIP